MATKAKRQAKPKLAGQIVLQVAPRRASPKKGKPSPTSKLTPRMREKMWKKGQSGNPTGRPKGAGAKLISQAYVIRLEEKCELPGLEDLTWAEAIALGMAKSAARGDTPAAKEIRETTEGKLPEHLRVGDPNGKPLTPPSFNVQFVDPKS